MSIKGYLDKWKEEHPNGMFTEPVRPQEEPEEKEPSREMTILTDFFGSPGFKAFVVTLIAAAVVLLVLINLKITDVHIEGNVHTSDAEIMKAFFPDERSWNPFLFRLTQHTEEPKEFLFVEKYQIEYRGLTAVDIIIYEKQIVGYIDTGQSYMFFDQDGVVVESSEELTYDDVPEVRGLVDLDLPLIRDDTESGDGEAQEEAEEGAEDEAEPEEEGEDAEDAAEGEGADEEGEGAEEDEENAAEGEGAEEEGEGADEDAENADDPDDDGEPAAEDDGDEAQAEPDSETAGSEEETADGNDGTDSLTPDTGVALYKTLPADERVLREVLQVSQFIRNRMITWGGQERLLVTCVDYIDVDEHRGLTCVLGPISVYLGGASDMEAKLMEMADILPELEGREGTLYLNTYNEHAEDPAYVFK